MSKKKRKRKLRAQMEKRGVDDATALVICGGKKCAPREESRAVLAVAQQRAAGTSVRVEVVGCLHVCKKGPIAATYPKIRFKKRVDGARACKLVDKLAAGALDAAAPGPDREREPSS